MVLTGEDGLSRMGRVRPMESRVVETVARYSLEVPAGARSPVL
jgi:hypothetical protein